MKSQSKTEPEMRDEQAPSPTTVAELAEYIESLTVREHDYGTCVYAMSLAATAAFNHVASKLGVSGFQASCADMDILTRTRSIKGPWTLIKGEDALFPQYDLRERLEKALGEWRPWLAEEAKKRLAEKGRAHPDIIRHWADLAFPDCGDEWHDAHEKASFLSLDHTPEFVEKHADAFKRFGVLDVYFTDDISSTLADSCKDGCSHRLDMPVSLHFERNIHGIKTSWTIDTEVPGSNGASGYQFDFQKLARLENEASNPAVKDAIADYASRARAAITKATGEDAK